MTRITRTAESLTDADLLFVQLNCQRVRRDDWLDYAATIGRGLLLVIAAATVGVMLSMTADLARDLPGVIERAKVEAGQ